MELLKIITFIVGVLALVIFKVTLKKNKENNKYIKSKILLGTAVICLVIRVTIPEIQYLIKFDSPEIAYRFVYLEKNPTVLVGTESACVTGEKGYLTLEKKQNGWKIPSQDVTTEICMKTVEGTTIFLNQYKNTDDYYMTVLNFSGISPDICDNFGSVFYKRKKDSVGLDGETDIYDAYLSKLNNQYMVTVNGVEIVLLE